jgi:hypothetical protein
MDYFIFQDFKEIFRTRNYSLYKENYCTNATNFNGIREMSEIAEGPEKFPECLPDFVP